MPSPKLLQFLYLSWEFVIRFRPSFLLSQCSPILIKPIKPIEDQDRFLFLMSENSKLWELEQIKDYVIQRSSSLDELGNSLNSNSLFPSGHTIYAEQWAMEKSLQEGHVSLQASRDEGRTSIGAVGILIVKEKAGQSQDLKFPSKSKLHPRSNQGCLSLPFTLPSLS